MLIIFRLTLADCTVPYIFSSAGNNNTTAATQNMTEVGQRPYQPPMITNYANDGSFNMGSMAGALPQYPSRTFPQQFYQPPHYPIQSQQHQSFFNSNHASQQLDQNHQGYQMPYAPPMHPQYHPMHQPAPMSELQQSVQGVAHQQNYMSQPFSSYQSSLHNRHTPAEQYQFQAGAQPSYAFSSQANYNLPAQIDRPSLPFHSLNVPQMPYHSKFVQSGSNTH